MPSESILYARKSDAKVMMILMGQAEAKFRLKMHLYIRTNEKRKSRFYSNILRK